MRYREVWWVMGLGIFLAGCGSVNEDLSHQEPYVQLIGKQFRTKENYVIFSFRDEKKNILISRHDGSFPSWERITAPLPFKYQNKIIRGILPTGSEFKVVKVKQEGSKGMNFTRPYVEITRSPDPEWIGKVMYPSGMTTYDRENPVPRFKSGYVGEITLAP